MICFDTCVFSYNIVLHDVAILWKALETQAKISNAVLLQVETSYGKFYTSEGHCWHHSDVWK